MRICAKPYIMSERIKSFPKGQTKHVSDLLDYSLWRSWIPKTLSHCYFIPKNSSLLSRKQLPVKEGDIVWASYIFHKTMALENIDDLVFWNIYFGISCLSWLYFSQDLDAWNYWYFEISISVFVVWAGFISHKTLTLENIGIFKYLLVYLLFELALFLIRPWRFKDQVVCEMFVSWQRNLDGRNLSYLHWKRKINLNSLRWLLLFLIMNYRVSQKKTL